MRYSQQSAAVFEALHCRNSVEILYNKDSPLDTVDTWAKGVLVAEFSVFSTIPGFCPQNAGAPTNL
jgi:hypothetical protein